MMTSFFGINFVCVLILAVVNAEESQQTIKCSTPVGHYTEIGCKPVFSDQNTTCPVTFDCPSQETRGVANKCYYKNKAYDIGDTLDDNETEGTCSVGCRCHEGHEGKAIFTCAHIDCAEFFRPPNPECVRQHTLKSCCTANTVCNADAIKALKTCKLGDKVFREGERFSPEGSCSTCICSKDFDGTLGSLECRSINCGLEIHYAENLKNKCAPVYFENRDCCPIEWKCAEQGDDVAELAGNVRSTNAQCTLGNMTLHVGDTLVTNDKCLDCKCLVPPMVTCIKLSKC